MRRALLAVTATLAIAVPAAAQDHGDHQTPPEAGLIGIRTTEVTPKLLRVLPGETVKWQNQSLRDHTVTSRDGLFDTRLSSGRTTSYAFAATGDYGYFCRLHPNITGTVAVRPAVLSGPAEPVVRGEAFALSGRVAPGVADVVIARDGAEVARTAAGADGHFSAQLRADAPGTYTAGGSDPVTVSVVEARTISAQRMGKRIHVRVIPAVKGATVVLQLQLRERFGWWPTATARTDAKGRATLRAPRRKAPARVALTAADGATVLATAPVRR
jgi:plastocyanin